MPPNIPTKEVQVCGSAKVRDAGDAKIVAPATDDERELGNGMMGASGTNSFFSQKWRKLALRISLHNEPHASLTVLRQCRQRRVGPTNIAIVFCFNPEIHVKAREI